MSTMFCDSECAFWCGIGSTPIHLVVMASTSVKTRDATPAVSRASVQLSGKIVTVSVDTGQNRHGPRLTSARRRR
jgi:hypothetical protein